MLVTGASGFIGSRLCKVAVEKGLSVSRVVRYARGVDCVAVDEIGPETEWAAILEGVDSLVHLAARVHVMDDAGDDPLTEFRRVNVDGTTKLANQAACSGVRRLVFISSVKVNGEATRLRKPFTIMDAPDPQDPYAVSKHEAEQSLHRVAKESGLEVVILRSPLVYGPRVKANFLRLLKVVECGIPLPLASVNNRRSLIYLENLVDAIITCIKHPKAAGQTYFVSDGEDVSTPELIQRISSSLGRPSRLFPFPPVFLKVAGIITGKSVSMDRLLGSLTVDCSKIRRELDWEPPYTMDQGLKETAKWYEKSC